MATVNPPKISRPRRILAFAALILGALLAFFWQPLNSYAILGAANGARISCSCHFLGGRSLTDCRKDFEPGMELVMLSADETAKSVTARFPLLSRQTATFREGEGCRLEPWAN